MSLPSLGYKSDSFMPWDEAIHIIQSRVISGLFSLESQCNCSRYFQWIHKWIRGGRSEGLGQEV